MVNSFPFFSKHVIFLKKWDQFIGQDPASKHPPVDLLESQISGYLELIFFSAEKLNMAKPFFPSSCPQRIYFLLNESFIA